jgi:hypothetical protein
VVHDDGPVGLDDVPVVFDDERVVSDAGIALVATLAGRGIEGSCSGSCACVAIARARRTRAGT